MYFEDERVVEHVMCGEVLWIARREIPHLISAIPHTPLVHAVFDVLQTRQNHNGPTTFRSAMMKTEESNLMLRKQPNIHIILSSTKRILLKNPTCNCD